MSHDDALPAAISGATCGRRLAMIFVGQAVESVAAHALRVEPLRDRIMIGDRAVAAVERGVEAGDLRQVRACVARIARTGARLLGWWSGASGT